MRIFWSFLATAALGYDGCILSPAIDSEGIVVPLTTKAHKKYTTAKFDSKYKFFGPLGEKFTKCTINPKISDDGQFWILPDTSTCLAFYCNFKHDSSRVKYDSVTCEGQTLLIESDNFNGPFTPDPSEDSFFCPTLKQGVCAVPMPGVVHPLPTSKLVPAAQTASWQSGSYHTCGRTAFLGTVGRITSKNGMQIGDSFFTFNMKKMFYYCDSYVPEKKKTTFKVILNKKTGVFGQCRCNEVSPPEYIPFPKKSCNVQFSGKFLGKYNSMAKKSSCDDSSFVLNESGVYDRSESIQNNCCSAGRCSDPNAICTDIPVTDDTFFSEAGYRCTCPSQYFDNSPNQDGSICTPRACPAGNIFDETAKGCVNINECLSGEHTCHDDAVCTDKVPTEGQVNRDEFYSCQCKPETADENPENAGRNCVTKCQVGFLYNAEDDSCVDIDECSLNMDSCVANSHCINTIGFVNGNEGYDCTCDSGYSGDGLVDCTDDDECDSSPCASCETDCSICTNLPGSFTCQCLDGFDGDGFTCSDINECNNLFLNSTYAISDNSDCVNSVGHYHWTCHSGYAFENGTRTDCMNIDECQGTPCGCDTTENCVATCTDEPGSYKCTCNSGFELDPNNPDTCTDIDECTRGTNNCITGEKCTNTIGGFFCDCDPDHPQGFCDECKFNHHNCHAYADCIDTDDAWKCACVFGWSDRSGSLQPGTDCKQDGDFYPLYVKAFETGLTTEQRTGIQTPDQRSSAWPELPDKFGCTGRVWDRNIADYVPTYNSQIADNMHLFEDIRYDHLKVNPDDFVNQVKLADPVDAWSWGTWGEWGEWSSSCTRMDTTCKLMHQTAEPNLGWQTRERACLVDGVSACHTMCMPVDDEGITPIDQKKSSKYPFISRVEREKAPREDWPEINGQKTMIFTFEEPFNPWYDPLTEVNTLQEAHAAMYDECRPWGSFISPHASLPTEKDENGEWIKPWDMEHPEEYLESRKKKEKGEIYICTHQWRRCEENAQWEHTDEDGNDVAGWSDWSQCYAQLDETQCLVSGHPNGDFGAPYSLTSDAFSRSIPIAHHYQQRYRQCSTGCYQDCLVQDLPDWKSDLTQFMKHSLTYQKFGDPKVDYSQSATINWRHCQHRIQSWGCPAMPFLSYWGDGRFPCNYPDIPEKSFTNGYLREGTVCSDVKPSLKRIPEPPFWSTDYNDDDNGVTMVCVCEPGCNVCKWEMDDVTKELGVEEHLPEDSHFNGIGVDYSFAGVVKHSYDETYKELEDKTFRFWYADEMPGLYGSQNGTNGLPMCTSSSSTRSKPYFGTMFDSPYHSELSRPDKSDFWTWDQFMCRIGMRFTEGAILYFNEFSFNVFQVEDRSKLEWVDATDFLTEDYRIDQIVTAADNNQAGTSLFNNTMDHWRIHGACRLVEKCSEREVKMGRNGCTVAGHIWKVHPGSMRMHRPGTFATDSANATAPMFCCKRTSYLHYAEAANVENNDDSWDKDWEADDEDTRFLMDVDRVIDPAQRLWDQDPRHFDEIGERVVVDEFARICDNRKIQILTVKAKKEITEWSAWSACSVSCGEPAGDGTYTGGNRKRQRVKIIHKFVPGNGVFAPEYSTADEDIEVETETCNFFACHTPHWSTWSDWGNCGRKNDEKWQKRTRACWYDGAPLKEWEDANKANKHTKTKKDAYCPRAENTEWRCCCEETECFSGETNLCPWNWPQFQFSPV